ncbi:MAG: class F sortase [Nocardiopsaceae bacterium]|nr:class F sortase [Nocardiopsaceae bacterium]
MTKPSWAARAAALTARKPLWAVVGVLAVVVGVVIGLVIRHGQDKGSPYDKAPAAAPAVTAKAPSKTATSIHGFRLLIPSIGTDAPVFPEGATGPGGGALTIPDDVHDVGWWDGVWKSPSGTDHEKVAAPGQPGVALLAGHINSAVQGQGALSRLQQLKPGAAITVGKGGKVTHWTVTRVQTVLKSALPDSLYVNHGPAKLAVVSCGGPFDSATGHYLDNVIAWAKPRA